MASHGDLITQFIEITGTDENTARFYLTSCDWDIEHALGNYWSTQADVPLPAQTIGFADNPAPKPTSSSGGTTTPAAAGASSVKAAHTSAAKSTSTSTSSGAASSASGSAAAPSTDVAPPGPKSKPKFATLSDMSKEPSSDDEQQAFYAGGSDRSGQQVLGPPKRKNFREQLTDMMRSAQEQNIAEVGPSTSSGGSSGSGSGNVWGQGMRLGMTDNDHTAVGTSRAPQGGGENKPVVVLKLWSQGFSIDGGELRHYDDPQNKEFLETVMRGEIPQELLEMGRMVNVDVEDHRQEDFKRQAAPQTFKGSGQKLGSPVANVVSESPKVPAALSADDAANQEASARDAINLNSEAPSTTLQIRLADGSRLAAQFNLSHTVSDIRRFIQTARPQYSTSNFILVSSFPTRELSDDNSTIEKAGLKNAALMQRLK